MLRVSKLTDYATVVMTCLVSAGDGVLSAQCLAERVRPNPGAATLVGTLAARGTTTVLVTGGAGYVGGGARGG